MFDRRSGRGLAIIYVQQSVAAKHKNIFKSGERQGPTKHGPVNTNDGIVDVV